MEDNGDGRLLARLDERTELMARDISSIKDQLAESYVTKEAFEPVKAVVTRAVAAALTAIIVALLGLVVGASGGAGALVKGAPAVVAKP